MDVYLEMRASMYREAKVEHTQPMQPRSAVASKPQDENASFQAQP